MKRQKEIEEKKFSAKKIKDAEENKKIDSTCPICFGIMASPCKLKC